MAWIKTVEEADAASELREVYAAVRTARGHIANIFKAQSANPRALRAHLDLYRTLMFGPSPLSRREREMIAAALHAVERLLDHRQRLRVAGAFPVAEEEAKLMWRWKL